MFNKILFSSQSNEWKTPTDLFKKLNDEFLFTVDVCATKENKLCENYFTKEIDGLKQNWEGVCWCNPPYNREIGKWLKKAHESRNNAATICLIPSRTDTKYWHEFVMDSDEIRFIKGRLKFNESKNSAPFPSCIVIFKKQEN
jgi:phage N-6-adenine-methyltransferase